MSQQQNNEMQKYFYRASAADFKRIQGIPVAYWVSDKIRACFYSGAKFIGDIEKARQGMATCDNARFLRLWHEVDLWKIKFDAEDLFQTQNLTYKWYPHNKGGDRRWFGNQEYVVNWSNNGAELRAYVDELNKIRPGGRLKNQEYYLKPAASWSDISTTGISARYIPAGFMFDTTGPSIFEATVYSPEFYVSILNSSVVGYLSTILNPTLHFTPNDVNNIPLPKKNIELITNKAKELIFHSKNDWDSSEVSWGFKGFPIIGRKGSSLKSLYASFKCELDDNVHYVAKMERENNVLVRDSYELSDEEQIPVDIKTTTLRCDFKYRYGLEFDEKELEGKFYTDTTRELISYIVGCMMGRYSLDREGLVYAHAGNDGFKALVEEGAYSTFAADDDGILPLTSENWFEDDVAARIEGFVATVWGKAQLEENLNFIADSLCLYAVKPVKKGCETARETIRRSCTEP
jgi:hypothetical protein